MTEAKRKAIQKLKDAGHFQAVGRKGGRANVAKHGPNHMEEIGRRGGEGLKRKFSSAEELRAFYSRIGSMTKEKKV